MHCIFFFFFFTVFVCSFILYNITICNIRFKTKENSVTSICKVFSIESFRCVLNLDFKHYFLGSVSLGTGARDPAEAA